MALALDEPKETDHRFEKDGVVVVLDKKLADQVGTVSVDFVEKGWRSGFVIATEIPLGFDLSSCGSGCSC